MGFSRKKKRCQLVTMKKNQRRITFTDVPILLFLHNKATFIEEAIKVLKTDNNVSLLLNLMNTC
jgi:hypothetical protein